MDSKVKTSLARFFEQHLFITLMEEAAEVTQATSKILRFGETEEKVRHLSDEVNDLIAILELINEEKGCTFFQEDHQKKAKKKEKVKRYFLESAEKR